MAESHRAKKKLEKLIFSKSQSSLEYLLIVALTLVLFVPTTYLFYNYSKESSQEISDAQIIQLGRNIVDSAESIFYTGQGSKTVIELNIPENVIGAVIIDKKELVFNVTTGYGISELVFFSSVNITGPPSSCTGNICNLAQLGSRGLKKVKIEALSKDEITIDTI
jgi:uncharacterized protein (UPF0333 family)